ncbi:MAG: nicotinate-nucleotide adenylyltransferase [Anaerolineae bacterium]
MNEPALQRLGVFGGTFDPIHLGHLVVAEEARTSLALDGILFIPARVSPFKLGQATACAEDRLRMVELAIADNIAFQTCRLEIEREGPSYTVDTLQQLRALYGPQPELYLLMGTDSLAMIASWHHVTELVQLARIVAYTRPGASFDLDGLNRKVPGLAAAVNLLDAVKLDISATDIRRRVRTGRTIRYMVPPSVEAYIHQHGLYLTEGTGVPSTLPHTR